MAAAGTLAALGIRKMVLQISGLVTFQTRELFNKRVLITSSSIDGQFSLREGIKSIH